MGHYPRCPQRCFRNAIGTRKTQWREDGRKKKTLLLNGLTRSHCSKCNGVNPVLAKIQFWAATVLGQNKRLLSRREKRARVGGRAEGKDEQAAQHNTRRRRLNPCEERRAPVPKSHNRLFRPHLPPLIPKSHNRLFRPHLPPLISAIGFKPALRCVVFGIPLRLLLLSACVPPAFPPVCK